MIFAELPRFYEVKTTVFSFLRIRFYILRANLSFLLVSNKGFVFVALCKRLFDVGLGVKRKRIGRTDKNSKDLERSNKKEREFKTTEKETQQFIYSFNHNLKIIT